MKINGVDVRRSTHAEALALLRACEYQLTLEIEFDVTIHDGLASANGPLLVEMMKPSDVPLGITLSGASRPGDPTWISAIRDAGIADRSGALHVGDRVLSINGVSLEQSSVHGAIQLLLQDNIVVAMEIVPHHLFSVRPGFDGEAFCDYNLSRWQHSLTSSPIQSVNRNLSPQSIGDPTNFLCHPETVQVELTADDVGFGFSLRGGANEYTNEPLFIDSISPNGPVECLGLVQAGDRIVAINGILTEGLALQQATKLIQESGDTVTLDVEFDVAESIVPTSGTFDAKLVKHRGSLGITINGNTKQGDPIWINKLKKGGVAYRIGSLKAGDVILAINGQSLENATLQDAADLLKNSGDVVILRISKDWDYALHADGLTRLVELHRVPGEKFGLRLNGSEEPGKKICVSEIREEGAAARNSDIRVGDCIVGINGVNLSNLRLSDAIQLIQNAGSTVTLTITNRNKKSKSHSKANRHSPKNSVRSHNNRMPSSAVGLGSEPRPQDTPNLPDEILPPYVPSPPNHNGVTAGQDSDGEVPLDPSLASVQELLNSKLKTNPAIFTETEDESVVNEEGSELGTIPSLQHSEHTSSKGSVPSDQYAHRDIESSSETIHRQEMLSSSSFSSRPFQKFSSSKSGRSSVAKSRVSPRISDSDADDPGKEILKDIEQAVMTSSAFIKEFKRLADSGSSDPDSDNDRRPPSYRRKHHALPPRMAHKVMEQMKQIATPTPVELHEVFLERTAEFSDFGFSVSDGLIEPGIFIRTIKPNGLAELSGQLKPYDRILKINHHVVKDLDCKGAVPILAGAGNTVHLVVSRNPFAGREWNEEV
jgi:C-terminal processing protease CtpA/Prc